MEIIERVIKKKKPRSVNTSVWYVGRGKMMYLITE